jgi:hypothetical protein
MGGYAPLDKNIKVVGGGVGVICGSVYSYGYIEKIIYTPTLDPVMR